MKIEAAESRKADVEYETSRCVWTFAAQELLCRSAGPGLEAYRSQEPLERGSHRGLIVHDIDNRRSLVHGCVYAIAGKEKWKAAP